MRAVGAFVVEVGVQESVVVASARVEPGRATATSAPHDHPAAGPNGAVKGATIGEALTDLTGQHQDLRKNLFNDEGKLRSFVNVYLNDEDIRYLNKEATAVKDSDTISIVPSIAGGSALETMAPPATLSKDEMLAIARACKPLS